MSRTFVQPGNVLTFTAPTGGVTSGVPLFIGARFVIPLVTAAAAALFEAMVTGVHAYTKTASQAWAEGQKIFWDVANAKFTSDPTAGPFVGFAAKAVGAGAGETTGEVALCDCCPCADTYHLRKRVAVADVNAGATLLPAIPGRRYRMIDAATIAIGGAASAAFNLIGTVTAERKLVSNAAAQSTQNTLLRAGATGSTILADGASFTQNDANTPVTIKKDAGDVGTATHIDVLLTYAIDAA